VLGAVVAGQRLMQPPHNLSARLDVRHVHSLQSTSFPLIPRPSRPSRTCTDVGRSSSRIVWGLHQLECLP
jgi:hypothetical protein